MGSPTAAAGLLLVATLLLAGGGSTVAAPEVAPADSFLNADGLPLLMPTKRTTDGRHWLFELPRDPGAAGRAWFRLAAAAVMPAWCLVPSRWHQPWACPGGHAGCQPNNPVPRTMPQWAPWSCCTAADAMPRTFGRPRCVQQCSSVGKLDGASCPWCCRFMSVQMLPVPACCIHQVVSIVPFV